MIIINAENVAFVETIMSMSTYICIIVLVIISGAVYDLSQSYDFVFLVIGGVYVIATLVFGAAAILQTLRRQQTSDAGTIIF